MRNRLLAACSLLIAALCVACDDAPPLALEEIADCLTPDPDVAAPVDSALFAASARRCLDARGA